ncbi:MAG: hypothetical protein ACYDCO_15900 [Armatimonadota bacterium]
MMTDGLAIGTRRELFVDETLIESLHDARLTLQHPERREVVITFDAPWEDYSAFGLSVFRDGDVVKLYYRAAMLTVPGEEVEQHQALALSTDGGITFSRPPLERIAFQGSTGNNLLQVGGFPRVPPAFRDTNPACLPEQRYKGLDFFWGDGYNKELYAMTSTDGLSWRKMHDSPLEMPGQFDSVNTAFWDTVAGCYRSYTRYQVPVPPATTETNATVVRAVQCSTSPDFLHWTPPVPLAFRDNETVQLYTNSILPCPGAEYIYLGFPNRYVEDRIAKPQSRYPGINDALFMASRDGITWTRYLDAWVRPGLDPHNWTHRNNYPIWGIVETSPSEWSMYITEHYDQPGIPTRLRRLAIRPHGFVSLHADYRGGEVLTKPFTFSGSELRVNYATSAAGSLRVEVLQPGGIPLAGFTRDDMTPMYGDDLYAPVVWSGGSLSAVAGTPVRLRFLLKDADIFALRTVGD